MVATTPEEFLRAMRRLRTWAGNPSYRTMSLNCGGAAAPSTFCGVLGGREMPKLAFICAFVTACGGSSQDFQRWATAWRQIALDDEGETPARVVELHVTG